jgi:uncharacterized protein (TIGR02145 family)
MINRRSDLLKKSIFCIWIIIPLFIFFALECDDNKSSVNPDVPTLPVVKTAEVSSITQTAAECGGTITSDGGSPIIVRGICWSRDTPPTIADSISNDGTGIGNYTSSLTGLTSGTLYYVRAFATNSVGTGYGESISFTTAACATTVTDIDGNVYKTITIGDQVWMAENLKVTHYRNGEPIVKIIDNNEWEDSSVGSYCNYENNDGWILLYGRLYNWYAVIDSRNIAPEGWHIPSDSEWKQLEIFLGMSKPEADNMGWRGSNEGSKLKAVGTEYWSIPNSDATNESDFTALPGGYRLNNGLFLNMSYAAHFWTSTNHNSDSAWGRGLSCNISQISRIKYGYRNALSIRCIKDRIDE